MRRIRTKKKAKRKIPIKRRDVPHRVTGVLARMRSRGESLSKAARALRTTPRTVRKFVGGQLRRARSGRYSITSSDQLQREIFVLGSDGYEPVTVHSSQQAKLASAHLITIGRFLRTGDTDWLKRFRGKRIGGVELLTNPKRIREFAEADLVKLDALYRSSPPGGRRK
jgi:hypothetical protein